MDARKILVKLVVDESLPHADRIVTMAATLSADEAGNGEDRISSLPQDILRIIVSRLPIVAAVYTSQLSRYWRDFWRSVPLVLCDKHIPRRRHFPAPYTAITSVLRRHTGPFRAVHLSRWSMRSYPKWQLEDWPRLLAEKSVEDLVFVNFPIWRRLAADASVDLPADILRCTNVSRLHIGFWNLPSTTVSELPRAPNMFPNLVELGLHHITFDPEYIDYMMECSPKLKVLSVVANTNSRANIYIRSHSIVIVIFWASISKNLDVCVAPALDRLILWNGSVEAGMCHTQINICLPSTLRVIGYLEPRIHKLKVAGNRIKAGTKPSLLTVIPSVKILALKLRFAVREEVVMFLSLMRCFPNVETLHIMCDEADLCIKKQTVQFWKNADPVKCIQSKIKEVVFKSFRGDDSELSLLEFLLESASMLKKMKIVLAGDEPTQNAELVTKLQTIHSTFHATEDSLLEIIEHGVGDAWCFRQASDTSVFDPFDW